MWSFVTKPLDRLAMRSACGSVRPSPDGNCRADEALAMLARPDFFAPEVPPAAINFDGNGTFTFQSSLQTACPGNNLVRGRWFPAAGDWRERPSLILLHGWNAERQYQWMFPSWGQLLARAGVSAIMFELPYHASRRPGREHPIRNFLSGDLLHVMHATHQALADARAVARWLRAAGSPSVGIWGVSLGAWLAGLAVSNQRELSSAVLLTPVVRMDRALQELPFCASIRDDLARYHGHFSRLNLIAHRPLCDARNVLMVISKHDLFAPAETTDELERAWNSEVWRVPHGHISILLANHIIRRTVDWVVAHSTTSSATQAA